VKILSPHAPRAAAASRIDPELDRHGDRPRCGRTNHKASPSAPTRKIDIEDGGHRHDRRHDGAAAEEAQRIIEG